MIVCETCKADLTAGKCKLPVWGVPTVSRLGLESHYFCSEQHGNDWIETHPKYAKYFGIVVDEKN